LPGKRKKPTDEERVKLDLDPEEALRALLKVDPEAKPDDQTMTPTEVAVAIWGSQEGESRSHGAREVRRIARDLFPDDAPGQGDEWHLTPDQVAQIRAQVF
jgi:hypothetical protein